MIPMVYIGNGTRDFNMMLLPPNIRIDHTESIRMYPKFKMKDIEIEPVSQKHGREIDERNEKGGVNASSEMLWMVEDDENQRVLDGRYHCGRENQYFILIHDKLNSQMKMYPVNSCYRFRNKLTQRITSEQEIDEKMKKSIKIQPGKIGMLSSHGQTNEKKTSPSNNGLENTLKKLVEIDLMDERPEKRKNHKKRGDFSEEDIDYEEYFDDDDDYEIESRSELDGEPPKHSANRKVASDLAREVTKKKMFGHGEFGGTDLADLRRSALNELYPEYDSESDTYYTGNEQQQSTILQGKDNQTSIPSKKRNISRDKKNPSLEIEESENESGSDTFRDKQREEQYFKRFRSESTQNLKGHTKLNKHHQLSSNKRPAESYDNKLEFKTKKHTSLLHKKERNSDEIISDTEIIDFVTSGDVTVSDLIQHFRPRLRFSQSKALFCERVKHLFAADDRDGSGKYLVLKEDTSKSSNSSRSSPA